MALLALAAIASRAISLGNGLVFDDYLTVMHRSPNGWADVLAGFVRNPSQNFGSNFYRPVLAVLHAALYQLVGASALGWHAASILLHVACTLLVAWLALEVLGEQQVAVAAAVLFAVHPAHVEAVGWVSAMGDPLMAAFLLLSALAFVRWAKGGAEYWRWLSVAASAGCVFSKETGVVVPLLVLAAVWVVPVKMRVRKLSAVAPLFAVAAAFLVVRRMVLPAFASPMNSATTAQMIATWPSALLFYLRHMAWPGAVVPFYPLRMASGFNLAQFAAPLAGLVLIAAIAGIVLWRTLGGRTAIFCAAWMLLPLAPVMMLKVFASFELVHDRFLYVPLVGFTLAVAGGVHSALRRVLGPGTGRIYTLLIAVLAAAWCCASLTESLWWQNDRALFTHALTVTPDNPRALVNLADAYTKVNRLDDARPLFERALQYDPACANAMFGLGLIAYRQANDAEAERQLERALQAGARYEEWEYLARTELRMGKLDKAEQSAREAVRTCHGAPGALEAFGEVLLARGDRRGAATAFAAELRLNPQSPAAREGMARMPGSSGR
jgi:hypothetical protein